MSEIEISPIVRRMARPKKFVEEMVARFMAGTFARIAGVLRDGEDRADLVRDAVDAEIKRREGVRNRWEDDALQRHRGSEEGDGGQ